VSAAKSFPTTEQQLAGVSNTTSWTAAGTKQSLCSKPKPNATPAVISQLLFITAAGCAGTKL
jgi:hypothetical protein